MTLCLKQLLLLSVVSSHSKASLTAVILFGASQRVKLETVTSHCNGGQCWRVTRPSTKLTRVGSKSARSMRAQLHLLIDWTCFFIAWLTNLKASVYLMQVYHERKSSLYREHWSSVQMSFELGTSQKCSHICFFCRRPPTGEPAGATTSSSNQNTVHCFLSSSAFWCRKIVVVIAAACRPQRLTSASRWHLRNVCRVDSFGNPSEVALRHFGGSTRDTQWMEARMQTADLADDKFWGRTPNKWSTCFFQELVTHSYVRETHPVLFALCPHELHHCQWIWGPLWPGVDTQCWLFS